jgi:hypothetical protein
MGNFWSQPIRVECTEHVQLITCRTINSALWFVNNPALEKRIYAYLAKYARKYNAVVYGFVLLGNHYHILISFPFGGRSWFFRDFNARVAEAVKHYVAEFAGGPLFERRFSPQVLPLKEDVFKYFFYCALQCVSSGLCPKISQYPAYNFFHDAAQGRSRSYKLFNYGKYHAARRYNPGVNKKDFVETHELKFERLPGFEGLSCKQYYRLLHKELEQRRVKEVQKRLAQGKGFAGRDALRKVVPGSIPHSTKKGGIRPLVLSICKEAKKQYLDWYFSVVAEFRAAVKLYRARLDAVFPEGTFKPPGVCISP